jgi:hypothetical protein
VAHRGRKHGVCRARRRGLGPDRRHHGAQRPADTVLWCSGADAASVGSIRCMLYLRDAWVLPGLRARHPGRSGVHVWLRATVASARFRRAQLGGQLFKDHAKTEEGKYRHLDAEADNDGQIPEPAPSGTISPEYMSGFGYVNAGGI